MKKALVTYFSATGTTANLAKTIASAVSADISEIIPKKPYTKGDLDWTNSNSRSTLEMRDENSRPEIVNDNLSIADYDTIFVGFPIWWYTAPTIINTFLESYDFSGKTIVPFATSGGSPFGKSGESLKRSTPNAKITEGRCMRASESAETIKKWVEGLNI